MRQFWAVSSFVDWGFIRDSWVVGFYGNLAFISVFIVRR